MAEQNGAPGKEPHVILVPMPLIGHIYPMLELACYLASSGIIVTYVHYGRPAAGLMRNTIIGHIKRFGDIEKNPNFRLKVLPDGLSKVEEPDKNQFQAVREASAALQKELESLIEQSKGENPVTWLVNDNFFGWAQDVADKYNIPRTDLYVSSAMGYLLHVNLPLLFSKGHVPGSGNNTETEEVTCVSGLPAIRPTDFPSYFTDGERCVSFLKHLIQSYGRSKEAERVFIHTSYDLEGNSIEALRADGVNVFPIGPLLASATAYCKANPLPEDVKVLSWLDKQRSSSVLLVNFGSTGTWSAAELQALALGLEASNLPFVFVVRDDMVEEGTAIAKVLPEGFEERTKGRGLIASWVSQLTILSHTAVGGFLTHCGFNSALESIYMGVPMVGWPKFAGQRTHLWLMTNQWKVGFPIADDLYVRKVSKEDVEGAVKELMEGERGKEVRKKALELREVVRKAELDGVSNQALKQFAHDVKQRAKAVSSST